MSWESLKHGSELGEGARKHLGMACRGLSEGLAELGKQHYELEFSVHALNDKNSKNQLGTCLPHLLEQQFCPPEGWGILSPHYWPRAMAENESSGALPPAELHPLPHSPGGTRNLVLQRDKGFLSTGQSGAEVLGKGAEPGKQRVWQMDQRRSQRVWGRGRNPGRKSWRRQFLDLT